MAKKQDITQEDDKPAPANGAAKKSEGKSCALCARSWHVCCVLEHDCLSMLGWGGGKL